MCPVGPDYCCHYRIFPTRYLLYHPLQLALAFEVYLAGLMLIVAGPVDLVLGLMPIVATPQTPISISLKCWVGFFINTILFLCQIFCKITHNVCLFCCKFLMNVEEISS